MSSRSVMPGELVTKVPEDGNLRLGSGTSQCGNKIQTTKAGVLRQTSTKSLERFWVETKHQRYVPSLDDLVLGIIVDSHVENFAVDVGGPVLAQLPILDFNGATRRNRPLLRYGDVVYARVTQAHPDIDPVITCVDNNRKASQGLGPLKGGYALRCTTGFSRDLLSKSSEASEVLTRIGEHFQYECCIGVNGMLWIKGEKNKDTLLIKNLLLNPDAIEKLEQHHEESD